MWRMHLENIGEMSNKYEVVEIAKSGASGPKVLFVKDTCTSLIYALKYGNPDQLRVPLVKQVANRKTLVPLFGENHLPPVLLSGEKIILMPALKGETLHNIVVNGIFDLSYVRRVYAKLLKSLATAWQKTAKDNQAQQLTREPISRANRIAKSVLAHVFGSVCLYQVKDLRLKINGRSLPSISELLKKMTSLYVPPQKIIICHGDPNADNIIFNDYEEWWLVDWEWVGLHDWRVMCSHLVGWWQSNASLMLEHPTFSVDNDCVVINYKLVNHPLVEAIMEDGWEYARKMALYFGEENWKEQILLQLAILLLGDLRFLDARSRTNHALPILGEGLSILADLE